ncbi:MAG: redoxin domain-containing protein [Nitrospinota bacterium]|jgi:cytochrome oxidase Cu insertion factor (SCO1/SenC/PrrC family)|nr:redoxin domain-containing protein [Nitrospinota bacterium]
MRSLFRICLVRALLGASALAPFLSGPAFSADPLSIGREAPAFTAEDAYGKTFDLAAHRGQGPLILVFYRGYF